VVSRVALALLLRSCAAVAQQTPDDEKRFVIVVTGMLVSADGRTEMRNLAAGEGAVVDLLPRGGRYEASRSTAKAWRRGSATYYTADFAVAFDAVYDIVITFADGTVIRTDNYSVPDEWKTHFEFHDTTGTTSPSSVVRVEADEKTALRCYIYGLWPWSAYQKVGGRQVDRNQEP
jgi:hypothetical protein